MPTRIPWGKPPRTVSPGFGLLDLPPALVDNLNDYEVDVPGMIIYDGERLGGYAPIPHFVVETLMRIHADIRKCVVYVGLETPTSFVPQGTGFLVYFQYTPQVGFLYLVAAQHVIDDLQGDRFWIRINRVSGGAVSVPIAKSKLIVSGQPANDLAICPLQSLDAAIYDYRVIMLSRSILHTARTEVWDIGIGDEVVTMGLYTSQYGLTKNMPVTRVGNIALLTEEKVLGPNFEYVEAYLVELRSIAGLSGSPVFVNPPLLQIRGGEPKYIKEGLLPGPLPLGVLIGYHLVESAEDQIPVPEVQPTTTSKLDYSPRYSADQRNTGLGVVIPIERVLEALEEPHIRDQMQHVVEEQQSGYKLIPSPRAE